MKDSSLLNIRLKVLLLSVVKLKMKVRRLLTLLIGSDFHSLHRLEALVPKQLNIRQKAINYGEHFYLERYDFRCGRVENFNKISLLSSNHEFPSSDQYGNLFQINTVVLTGRLGADPQIRYFEKGKCVATANLAVKREYHPLERKALGVRYGEEETDWFQLDMWNQLGERAMKILSKGCRTGIVGSLHFDSWIDMDGNERKKPKIIVKSFEVLESKIERNSRGSSSWITEERQKSSGEQENSLNDNPEQRKDDGDSFLPREFIK